MTAEALLAGLGWPAFGALLALSWLSSFLTAALWLGGGSIMLAALASLLPPPAVVPVHGVVQLGSNAGRGAVLARHADRAALPPFLGGAALGAVAGGALSVETPPGALEAMVGGFILWTLLAPPPGWLRRSAAAAGAATSALTMFVGATGPFVAAYVRALGLERRAHVATHATLMTAQHLLKCVAFGLFGFAFAGWPPLALALAAAGFLGTLAGRRVLMRVDEALFRRALSILLALVALRLLLSGLASLTGLA